MKLKHISSLAACVILALASVPAVPSPIVKAQAESLAIVTPVTISLQTEAKQIAPVTTSTTEAPTTSTTVATTTSTTVATTTSIPPTTEMVRAEAVAAPAPTTPPSPSPEPPPTTVATTAPAAPAPSGCREGDPYCLASWDRLAQCESGGNWSINTGNGYYGGIQFSLSSWRAVGGTGYPHQASKATQIEMGQRLWEAQGWGAWPGCTRSFGWR